MLTDVLDGMSRDIKKVLHRQHDQEQQAILDWLSSADYASQQNDFIGRRQEGSGEWLFKSYEFQQWENREKHILFCPGIPGAGKTIATSIVIDYLYKKFQNDNDVGIAYIYCNFRRRQEQTLTGLFSSVLRQLTQNSSLEVVSKLYECHKSRGTRPTFKEILNALHSVIACFSRVFILVDALDECQISEGVFKFMTEIFNLQAKTGLSLFATSRSLTDIKEEFERRGALSLEIRARNEDVRSYLDNHSSQLPPFIREDHELENRVKSSIIEAADGM
jgi:hypothetical protein